MEQNHERLFERAVVALQAANIGVWDWRIDTDETVYDDRYYEMAGYEPGAFDPNYVEWRARVHPDDIDAVEVRLRGHLSGELPDFTTEFRFRKADGDWMWIGAIGRIVERDDAGAPSRMVGTHTDVSDRKASEALVQSFLKVTEATTGSEFFTAFTRHLGESVDVDTVMVGEVLPGDRAQVTTLAVWDDGQLAPNLTYDLEGTPCAGVAGCEACIHTRDVRDRFPRSRLLRDFGAEGYVGIPLCSADKQILGLVVLLRRQPLDPGTTKRILPLLEVFSDRAAAELLRMRAEQALRRQEEDLRITLESIGDAVIATDDGGRVTRLNRVAEELTGWSRAEARGRPLPEVFHIVHGETGELCENPVEKVLESGKIVGLANHTDLIARDGTRRQIADSGAPIRNASGLIVGVVLVFRDVTERHRIEDQLRHARRMDAVGQLAGGIAHDFNNMLAGILGYAELLESQLEPGTESREFAVAIARAAERAGELTAKLLAYSRRGQSTIEVFDLHAEILAVRDLLARTLPRAISVTVRLDAPGAFVEGDPAQIQSAILNLAVNARDAMPDGGELDIATAVREVAAAEARGYELAPGPYLEVAVADTGLGIAPDLVEHLFEPYFTTKQAGDGTGLGLAAVYGTAREHGGHIVVETIEGEGTTFRLLLPLVDGATVPGTVQVREAKTAREGRVTVLVIDDEDVVRNVTGEVLRQLGHTVHEAADGASGVALFDAYRHDIDVVVLDVSMPGMGGPECFRRIREIDPGAQIVIATGFAADEDLEGEAFPGRAGFLHKPVRTRDLVEAVRTAASR